MNGGSKELNRRLEELKTAFANKLVGRLDEFELAGRSLNEGDELSRQTEKLNKLFDIAHKLAGSAGTFGFEKLGDLASEIEVLCDDIIAAKRSLNQADLAEFCRHVSITIARSLGSAGFQSRGSAGAEERIA